MVSTRIYCLACPFMWQNVYFVRKTPEITRFARLLLGVQIDGASAHCMISDLRMVVGWLLRLHQGWCVTRLYHVLWCWLNVFIHISRITDDCITCCGRWLKHHLHIVDCITYVSEASHVCRRPRVTYDCITCILLIVSPTIVSRILRLYHLLLICQVTRLSSPAPNRCVLRT